MSEALDALLKAAGGVGVLFVVTVGQQLIRDGIFVLIGAVKLPFQAVAAWKLHGRFIRIAQAPAGEAPIWVREAWVGLTLPLVGRRRRRSVLVDGDRLSWDSYAVPIREAVETLEATSPAAAEWWRREAHWMFAQRCPLIFPASACEEVSLGQP